MTLAPWFKCFSNILQLSNNLKGSRTKAGYPPRLLKQIGTIMIQHPFIFKLYRGSLSVLMDNMTVKVQCDEGMILVH